MDWILLSTLLNPFQNSVLNFIALLIFAINMIKAVDKGNLFTGSAELQLQLAGLHVFAWFFFLTPQQNIRKISTWSSTVGKRSSSKAGMQPLCRALDVDI